jgi:hypothetical protein
MVRKQKTVQINLSGQTYTLMPPISGFGVTVISPLYDFVIEGSGSILADNEFILDGGVLPVKGMSFLFSYKGNCTNGGGTINILGTNFTDAQLGAFQEVEAIYNGVDWDVFIVPNFTQDSVVEDRHLVSTGLKSISATAANSGSGGVLVVNDNGVSDVIEIQSGSTRVNIADGTGFDTGVPANIKVDILDGAIDADALTADVRSELIVVQVSFESGEQCENTIKIPYKCVLTSVGMAAYVTKAIEGTDNGLVELEINGVGFSLNTITFNASSGLNASGIVGGFANQSISAGSTLNVKTSKATAGGKAIISIPLIRVS